MYDAGSNRGERYFSRRGIALLTAALLGAINTAGAARAASRPADQVFIDGLIYTQDPTHPWAEAFAVAGGKYLAVGGNAAIRALVGPKTRVVALNGRMVMSGLIDDHVHAVDGAMGELYDCLFASWPEEAIGLADALHIYTLGGAQALRRDQGTGSIVVGKSADFIVLDRNLFKVAANLVGKVHVEMTYFHGRLVYQYEAVKRRRDQ